MKFIVFIAGFTKKKKIPLPAPAPQEAGTGSSKDVEKGDTELRRASVVTFGSGDQPGDQSVTIVDEGAIGSTGSLDDSASSYQERGRRMNYHFACKLFLTKSSLC